MQTLLCVLVFGIDKKKRKKNRNHNYLTLLLIFWNVSYGGNLMEGTFSSKKSKPMQTKLWIVFIGVFNVSLIRLVIGLTYSAPLLNPSSKLSNTMVTDSWDLLTVLYAWHSDEVTDKNIGNRKKRRVQTIQLSSSFFINLLLPLLDVGLARSFVPVIILSC